MARKIDYASLYTLRKDGRYQGYYRDETGKRRAVYDRDPEALWHKINDPKEPEPITFEEIAYAWKEKHWGIIRPGTVACYESPFKKAVSEFGDTPATEIEPSDIHCHLLRLRSQGLSAKTIKTQLTVYNQIYQNAIIDPEIGREIRNNPAAAVKAPTALKKAVKREAPEDEIIDKIRSNATTARFGLFALVLVSTGFRRGEALALQWQDIDFKAKEIHCSKNVVFRGTARIAETKTSSGVRTVPLLPDLAAVLKKPKNAKKTDYIFHGEDPSKHMHEAAYKRYWLRYCRDMGFVTDEPEERISKQGKKYIVHHYKPTLTAHVFRHGYATMLFEADVDEYTAQKLLGHADITTTRAIYTHLRQKKKNESVEKLRNFVLSKTEKS